MYTFYSIRIDYTTFCRKKKDFFHKIYKVSRKRTPPLFGAAVLQDKFCLCLFAVVDEQILRRHGTIDGREEIRPFGDLLRRRPFGEQRLRHDPIPKGFVAHDAVVERRGDPPGERLFAVAPKRAMRRATFFIYATMPPLLAAYSGNSAPLRALVNDKLTPNCQISERVIYQVAICAVKFSQECARLVGARARSARVTKAACRFRQLKAAAC